MAPGRKTARRQQTTAGPAPSPATTVAQGASNGARAATLAGLDTGAGRGTGDQTAWGGAMDDRLGTTVDLPAGFTEEQLAAATAWASGPEGPSANVVRQLQTQLGLAPSGRYDRATVVAVVTDQQAAGLAATGRADAAWMRTKGLVFTREVVDLPVDDALLETLRTTQPDGFVVSIYADYRENTANAREFENQATRYASATGALGIDGGAVAAGVAIGVDSPATAVESLRQLHQSLQARWRAALTPYQQRLIGAMNQAGLDGAGPDWTKAQDVGLFAHGIPNAVNLNDDEYSYGPGLNAESYGTSNIQSFVDGIRGATTQDVDVQVFACSAARGVDETEAWLEHTQDRRMGQQSIAQELSTALGDEASVYSHTTAGHTTENYAARVFGADAGGGQGGLHMFDLLYPESFIQSELARIYPQDSAERRATRHDGLRDQMWRHYRGTIGPGKTIPGGDQPTGQLMFRDPDTARTLLQADWQAQHRPQQ